VAKPASLSSSLKFVLTTLQHELECPMSVSRKRVAGSFSISPAQLAILAQASQGARLRIDGPDDEAACVALWRAGLLRVNGESGFQLSQLGLAAVRQQATGGSGERDVERYRPAGEARAEAAGL
jgi:hypothetical protein